MMHKTWRWYYEAARFATFLIFDDLFCITLLSGPASRPVEAALSEAKPLKRGKVYVEFAAMPFSVLSDAPAGKDLLEFDRYSDPLIDVITSDRLQTPITIGIFGSCGTGKTSLLEMIERTLDEKPDRFLCVNSIRGCFATSRTY
jgi:hypothetical protein